MPANNAQYPAASVQTKNFPTSLLGIVTKFDPSTKYREEEEITNEDGTLAYIVGVDSMTEADVEIVMLANQNVPVALTNIAFNFTNTNLGTGNINYLIRGEVKVAGNAGHSKKVSFKAMNNSALP